MSPSYFTPERAKISNQLWAVTSAVGASLCFVVLVIIAILYTYPGSRIHLDRLSFRLMLYSLINNMALGILSTISGKFTGPSVGCSLAIFLLQLTLRMSTFLLFCIALNLQLVVVHGIRGKHLEKYYVACSLVMALIITIPPYAAGQYGWDPLEHVCWYTNENKQQRIAWQIGTQLVWTGLTVVGEVLTACTVSTYMLRIHYRQKHIISAATASTNYAFPCVKDRFRPSTSAASLKPMSLHAHTYANVVARIALYPLASCIFNLTSIFTVIHSSASDGIQNASDYRILLLSDFLYGGRVVIYALLALTDLALIRAVRTFVAHHWDCDWGSTATLRSRTVTNTRNGVSRARDDGLVVQVELSTVAARDHASGASGADMASDGKAEGLPIERCTTDATIASVGEEDRVPSHSADKAERGMLADLEAGARVDGKACNPARAVAFDLASPISPTQSIRDRWEGAARREQAEEEEFMRII
ncbi:unnamed protein product [Peniophora sp. CBMAI 1063]|nr:unnamed protein product [Peniophora sp. CBMAI 1063]